MAEPRPIAIETSAAASRRYLAALRGSIAASDLRLSTRAACAGTFAEGVAERVREGRHDLVIKNLADGLAADLALVKACRVPLLLTRPRSWRPAPRIWVALDLASADAAAGLRAVLVAKGLARVCAGSCRLVYSRLNPGDHGPSLAEELDILEGDPRETLPAALHGGEVDLLVIAQASGTAGHPLRTRSERSLTETLLGIDGCDVLIVPTEPGGSASRPLVGRAPLREDASHRHG
jgi:nucleotide-binding universal stress UspA family protein